MQCPCKSSIGDRVCVPGSHTNALASLLLTAVSAFNVVLQLGMARQGSSPWGGLGIVNKLLKGSEAHRRAPARPGLSNAFLLLLLQFHLCHLSNPKNIMLQGQSDGCADF